MCDVTSVDRHYLFIHFTYVRPFIFLYMGIIFWTQTLMGLNQTRTLRRKFEAKNRDESSILSRFEVSGDKNVDDFWPLVSCVTAPTGWTVNSVELAVVVLKQRWYRVVDPGHWPHHNLTKRFLPYITVGQMFPKRGPHSAPTDHNPVRLPKRRYPLR